MLRRGTSETAPIVGPEQRTWLLDTVQRLRSAGYGALEHRLFEPESVAVGDFEGEIEVFYDDERTKVLRVVIVVWPPPAGRASRFRLGSPSLQDDFLVAPDGRFVGEA